jgi:hypothetical protein
MSNNKQQTAIQKFWDKIALKLSVEQVEEFIPLLKESKEMEKERMIQLVQGLKDYTHESHTILGHDEREASEFVDIFYNETYGGGK